jgi:hypothetical protein
MEIGRREKREEKERGRMFFDDDEKKLERFFSPWLAAEEKGKGSGRGTKGKEVLCLLVCYAGLGHWEKYTVGR